MEQSLADTESLKPNLHALCLTRAELIFSAAVFAVGVGVSVLHEVLFGPAGGGRLVSTTIDAVQGSLFWSTILIALRRIARRAYRAVHTWLM